MLVPMQRVVLLLPAEEQPREVMDSLREMLQGRQGQPEVAEAQPDMPQQGEAEEQAEQQAEELLRAPGTPEVAQGDAAVETPEVAQPPPLPQRVTGRRGAAREAEHQMRLATQHLSPPRQGGRRMRRT